MVADSQESDCKNAPRNGVENMNVIYDLTEENLEITTYFNLQPNDNPHCKENETISPRNNTTFANQNENEGSILNVNLKGNNSENSSPINKRPLDGNSSNDIVNQIKEDSKIQSSKSIKIRPGTKLKNKRKSPSKKRKVMCSNKKSCFNKLSSKNIKDNGIEGKSAMNLPCTSDEESMKHSSNSESRFADVEDNAETSSGLSEEMPSKKRNYIPESTPMELKFSTESSSDSSSKELISLMEPSSSKEIKSSMEIISHTSDSQFADIEDNADSQNNKSETLKSDVFEINKSSSESKEELAEIIGQTLNSFKGENREDSSCSTNSSDFVEVFTHKLEPTVPTTSITESKCTISNSLKVRFNAVRSKKRRCFICKKKLDLTAVTCRCGGLFCARHRYDTEHNCSFDYKAMGVEQLRRDNPQIVAEKVSRL